MSTEAPARPNTYGGLHEAPSTYLFGVSKKMFYVFASGIVAGIVALLAGFFISGAVILGVVVLTWAPLAARIGGKSGYEFATELTGWSKQRRRGQHILRAGSLSNAPGGRTRVPGIGAPIEMWWGIDKLGRRFGMSHLPKLHQYTIRLRCSVPGYKGVEQGQVDLDVANWGEFINLSGQTPDIEAIATIIETLPETGARQDAEITRLCKPGTSELAQAVVRESGTGVRHGIQLHTHMALTFTANTEAKRKDPMAMIADLAERLPSICANLGTFRVTAVPMSDHEISAVVRRAYDPRPVVEAEVESSLRSGEMYVDWLDAGPMTAEETKNTYFHEGAASRTWVMNAHPSGARNERILKALLEGHGDVPRKRVTLIHRPMSPADAVNAVESGYVYAVGERNAQRGIGSVRADLKVKAADRTRVEVGNGAGATAVSLIVTASASTEAQLDIQADTIESLVAGCSTKVRPAWRYQAAAFLSGVGVGVYLQDHATTAKTLQA